MKKILKTKRKYNYFDLLQLLLLFFGHLIAWGIFISLLYVANYLASHDDVLTIFKQKRTLSLYILIASPIVSYIFHAVFWDRGYTSAKAILWIHSMVVIIFGFISFVFF